MNVKPWMFGGTALMLALAGSFTLTASGQSSTIDETLRIAFIGGTEGSSDMALYQAAVLAAEQINDDDGVVGSDDTRYGFEVIYYEADAQTDVLEALDDAIADDAIAVLGPNDPTLAEAISDAGTPDVPVLLGASASPEGSSLFRLSAGYETWAESAADYLARQRQFDQIALLTVNTDSADAARDAFEAAVDADTIVADITFDADRASFSSEAATVREESAQAVFIWARAEQTQAILEALDDARWNGVVVFGGSSSALLDDTRANTGETFGLTNWSVVAYDADSQAFVADYADRWGTAPSDDAAAYFDAVSLLAAAVEASGSDGSSVASWLANTGTLDGVQGVYENAQTSAVRLLGRQGEQLVEAARFAGGVCENCPAYFVADTSDETADSSVTFRIGLITATAGDYQAQGDAIENAVRLAVREINEQGGALGPDDTRYTFSLNVYDATTVSEAEAAFEQAVADGVQVVLGPDSNAQVLANLTAAETASVLQLTSATSAQISRTESGDYVFQIRASDDALARSAADFLVNTREMTRFATVAANTDYGLDSIDAFADVIESADDGDILLQLEHDVRDTDMAPFAEQIVNSGAEAVAVWTTEPAAASLLAALDSLGWTGTFVYGYLTPEFVEANAAQTVELIGPVTWWPSSQAWTSLDFSARFSDRYNSEPGPQSAAYYDAVYLLQRAIRESGGAVGDIQTWLLDLTGLTGAQGTYEPERYAGGELTRSVLIIGAEGGVVTELSRYNAETCVAVCE